MQNSQQGSVTLYTIDLLCTFLAIGIFGFCIYIFPYVILGFQDYNVPEFVVSIAHWYQTHHSFNALMHTLFLFLPFLLAGFIALYIARLITFYMETHEYEPGVPHIDEQEYQAHLDEAQARHRKRQPMQRSTLYLIAIMVGALLMLGILEYFLVISVFN